MREYFDDIVKNISQIIRFNSAEAPAKESMPFGEGAAKCLEFYLSLASFLGFKTTNYDNYVGEVTFGSGEEFAVLAHLDVVPEGKGWTHDPFGGEVDRENARIWGRGAMDDKGPAIIALYALKALKDEGFRPSRKIKLILGCNEESGWACIDHYNKVAHMPEEGISPDADFPVIYAEKGILHARLHFPACGNFRNLKGGDRVNMVCDYCEAQAPFDVARAEKYGISLEDGKLVSRGKSAHGSSPDKGINAIQPMLSYLGLEDMRRLLFDEKLGLDGLQDETGKLTLSPDVIEQSGDDIAVTCDIRFPATMKKEQITDIIDSCGIRYEIVHLQDPLYNDRNSKLITTLLGVYNEVCGTDLQPIAIGGGTYARALKYGAAFGPEEAGEESTIHQANEYITFEKIEKCFKIYKLAIERLTK